MMVIFQEGLILNLEDTSLFFAAKAKYSFTQYKTEFYQELAKALYYGDKFTVDFIYNEKGKCIKRAVKTTELKAAMRVYIGAGGKIEIDRYLYEFYTFCGLNIRDLAEAKKKAPARKRKQTGTSNKLFDKQRKAKPVGKRTSASGQEYTETRANRSDVDRRKRL
jgi:hypothetical protein